MDSKSIASSHPASNGSELFEAARKDFSIASAWRSGLLFDIISGFHRRIGGDRVKRLQGTKPARKLSTALARASDRTVSYFAVLATVNKEQAEASFRYTAIVNFTAPVTVVLLANQVIPGGLIDLLRAGDPTLGWIRLSFVALVFLFSVIGPISLAYLGTSMARDLYHLAVIEKAKRGWNEDEALDDDGAELSAEPPDA